MGIGRLAVHTHLRLPQEVVDMIIDFLDARADWKHCARVCWSWVHASQLHLFRNISVSLTVLYGEEEPPVSRLKSVLDRAPHLAKHVRELEIVRDFGQCFNIRMQEQLLSLLIPLFPRIHSFSLKSVDCDQEFGIDASLLAAIRGILQSQHIKSITLYGWEFSDNAHFVSLMGDKLNSLTTFKIDSTGIDYRAPPSNHSVPKDGPPATLEILSISCSMKWIDDWFASLKHPVIVKKLILDGWGAGSLLITRFGKNLEELSLLMEDDYGPPIDFHHMKRLSKLVSTSSIDELVELHTIPEDNQLEDLELVHTWYWEISFAASAFNQLDELLASKHFSRLKTVTMVADRSSLSLEEFKLLRKTMRRVVRNGLLRLRFSPTGETLDSLQIQDQASRREIYLPSDFPWFLEAIQVQDEAVQEEEDVVEEEEETELVPPMPQPFATWPWPIPAQSQYQYATNLPMSGSPSVTSMEGNPTSAGFDKLSPTDFDAWFKSLDPNPVITLASTDPSAPIHHCDTLTLPQSHPGQCPETGSIGSSDNQCWSQGSRLLPSPTQSDLIKRGLTDSFTQPTGNHPPLTPQSYLHLPSTSSFIQNDVSTYLRAVLDVSNNNENAQSASPCLTPLPNLGSSVYSYFPYPNTASSSKLPETQATISYPSVDSSYSHTYPVSSASDTTWSFYSDGIEYGNSATNLASNLEYSNTSGRATNPPASHETYSTPIPHPQILHDSPPGLPPQPQFPSIPQIPAPSNPSYYKSTVEYIEDSLFTTVTEVVNTSPYHRQVWFSQTPATESGTSGYGPYDFPPANFSSTYPP